MKNKAKVTVVISTYNRPDVLKVAINSVMQQTFSNWEIFVIGDNCNQETENTVNSFNDSRINYINLPHRVGDQSGPNSVGIALATTEYIAFMNQDDIWIQDHLEGAIETLEKTKGDFFIGKGGFARTSKFTTRNLKEPIFDLVNPDNRTADMCFDKGYLVFESASSFVINTTHAKKIGYWTQGREIHRTSLQNWVLRAWRKKTKIVFGEKITVLNILTHNNEKTKSGYSVKSLEHIYLLDFLKNNNPDPLRKFVEKSLNHNKKPMNIEPTVFLKKKNQKVLKKISFDIIRKITFNSFTKSLFKYMGVDSMEFLCNLLIYKKGKNSNRASIRRTGKPLPEKIDTKMVIEEVKLARNS